MHLNINIDIYIYIYIYIFSPAAELAGIYQLATGYVRDTHATLIIQDCRIVHAMTCLDITT